MHEERSNKHATTDASPEGALPTYLLDREGAPRSTAGWRSSTAKPTTCICSYRFPRPWNSADSSTASRECPADTCAVTIPNSRNTIGGRNAYGRPATTREPQEEHR